MDYKKAIRDANDERTALANKMQKETSDSPEGIAFKEAKKALEVKAAEIRQEYWPQLLSIQDNIRHLEMLQKDANSKRFLNPKDFGDDFFNFYSKVFRNSDWNTKKKLVWVSDNKNNFLVVIPGHKYFGGRGTQNYYQTHYMLFKIDPNKAGYVDDNDKSCIWNKQGRLKESDWDDINRLGND